MAETIDITATIERLGVGRLAVLVIALCFAMMITDGYDFAALTVATPAILRQWQISPKAMGGVFSVTFLGLLCGSLFYGLVADRLGRKLTIVLGTLNFGLPVLLIQWSSTIEELMVLRFIGGLGMGGIVPVAYTLVSEFAPKRMRSTVTIITNAGYTFGAALSGLLAASFIPRFGWPSLFAAGAAMSLVMTVVLAGLLPESPQYLALRRPGSPALPRIVARLIARPVAAGTRFTAADPQETQGPPARDNVLQLFKGPRAAATLLLWCLFVFDALGFFFLASWLPVVMEARGLSPSAASLAQSLYGFAGMAGGFLVMRFLDRTGPIAMVALPLLGGPLEVLLGLPVLAEPLLVAALAGAGICLSGIHTAVYAIAVRFYPPSIRGRGVSGATVWGRAGGIVAPYVGGYFLAAHMPLPQLMTIAALPCLATAASAVALGIVYRRHFDLAPVAEIAAE